MAKEIRDFERWLQRLRVGTAHKELRERVLAQAAAAEMHRLPRTKSLEWALRTVAILLAAWILTADGFASRPFTSHPELVTGSLSRTELTASLELTDDLAEYLVAQAAWTELASLAELGRHSHPFGTVNLGGSR